MIGSVVGDVYAAWSFGLGTRLYSVGAGWRQDPMLELQCARARRFLTGALEAVSQQSGLGQAFLGLIVLPIAGNACEHITAVFVACKDKMDLAIGVSLGSSIQARCPPAHSCTNLGRW